MGQRHSQQTQRQLLEPLSTQWIEGAAETSRDTVAAWRNGRKPRADQWARFTAALNAWRDGLPETTKEPTPEWARALTDELLEAISAAGMTDQERAALRALDGTAMPTSGAAADPPESSAPGPARGLRPKSPRGR